MARPETTDDIEIVPTEFATVYVDKIIGDGELLAAYATFIKAVERAKNGHVVVSYSTRVELNRTPTDKEMSDQLRSAQSGWDYRKKLYDQKAELGACEHSYEENSAKKWAEDEGLPWPPPHEPISDFHKVIAGIDEVTAE